VDGPPVNAGLSGIGPVRLEVVNHDPEANQAWKATADKHHYLGYRQGFGPQLPGGHPQHVRGQIRDRDPRQDQEPGIAHHPGTVMVAHPGQWFPTAGGVASWKRPDLGGLAPDRLFAGRITSTTHGS